MTAVNLSDDILRGADEIAIFLYGDAKFRRRVYHLAANTRMPHFKLGGRLSARKSRLLLWIEAQEARGPAEPTTS